MKNNTKHRIKNLQELKTRKAELRQEMDAARQRAEGSLYKLGHTTPWTLLSVGLPLLTQWLKGAPSAGKDSKAAWWESLLSAGMGAVQAYAQFADSASSETQNTR